MKSHRNVLVSLLLATTTSGFVVPNVVTRLNTALNLEDWVADLIDGEVLRQANHEEYDKAWMEKNRAAVISRMESDYLPMMDVDSDNVRQRQKDERMANTNPSAYCADRCVATGHCDVYEDIFEMSPKDVIKFCVDCVLSDEQEECDIPGDFYNKLSP